jgi:hypothetical protein
MTSNANGDYGTELSWPICDTISAAEVETAVFGGKSPSGLPELEAGCSAYWTATFKSLTFETVTCLRYSANQFSRQSRQNTNVLLQRVISCTENVQKHIKSSPTVRKQKLPLRVPKKPTALSFCLPNNFHCDEVIQ